MEKYLTFLCKGQYFALSIDRIEKIMFYEPPVIVPETSEYILGYTSYEGQPMPIIDLNQRFFGERTSIEESTKVIVVHWQGDHLGLLVDEVSAIMDEEKQRYENTQEDSHESYIVQTFHVNDRIILSVDMDKMFVNEAEKELQRLLK